MTQTDHRVEPVTEPESSSRRVPARSIAAVGIVVLAVAIPLRELFRHQGPPMEEGFMLIFPELVLRGEIPNVDFLHLYGPGGLWLIAGFFKAFGTSLATERTVGLLMELGIVFAVFTLARPWGRRLAVACSLVAVLIVLFPVGLAALAWNGAVAFGLWALVAGLRWRRLVLAGVLGGLALLLRPDLILAVVLGLAVVAWRSERVDQRRLLAGLAIGLSPYLIHLVTAGPVDAFQGMVLDPVFELRDGRHLPIPPSTDRLDGALQKAGGLVDPPWPLPTLSTPMQVFVWFWLLLASAATLVVTGVRRTRRHPGTLRSRTLLAVALFGVGTLSQALQRPDTTHLAWVSYVPLGFLPVAVAELLRRPLRSIESGRRAVLAGAIVLVGIVALIPHFTARSYLDYSRQALFDDGVERWSVNHAGRNFWLGKPEVADEVQALLDDIDEVSEPGESIIVGPGDLRVTNYSDAYLYFLMPDLEPGTYFIEMDPGVANAPDSGLADELRRADLYVASNVWEVWEEDNASQELGSPEPNRVVDRHYCLVEDYGDWIALYRRCR